PAADGEEQVDRAAFAARRQEVARAVRNPHAQAAHRHLRADAADGRCADEARSAGGRRRRDQGVRQGAQIVMVTGIIGRKVGMTQVFDADGTVHPATVIKAGPCVVVQAKTPQSDGYDSVQLGFVEETPAKANKPTQGHFKKANVPATRVRREVKLAAGGDAPKAGDQVLVSIFADGERV